MGCLADPGPCSRGVLLQARDTVLLAPFSRQELTGCLLCAHWCFRLWGPSPFAQSHYCPRRTRSDWRLEQETDKIKAEKGEMYREAVSVDYYILGWP